MKNKYLFLILIITNIAFSFQSYAQQSAVYNQPESDYRLALELYHKEKFAAAQSLFGQIIDQSKDKQQDMIVNAAYYDAICALELDHKNTEFKLNNFIRKYPTSSWIKRIYFQLGIYQFRNRKYSKSLDAFQKVDRSDLSKNELYEYHFKIGFCYLQAEDIDKAKVAFNEVVNTESIYAAPSKYYIAHLAYLEKDFDTALPLFEALATDRKYKKIAPHYIVQIYFQQKNFDKVLDIAPELYITATGKLKPELAKILGGAYFEKSNFQLAAQYFEDYERLGKIKNDRSLSYQMGYSYMMIDNYKDAIRQFQKTTNIKDSLSQNAYYHLAHSYLKDDNKKFASNAFLSASKMDFDKDIKEESLFSYAKLSIELSHDPYNEAIKSLEDYIAEYPNSPRKDEAFNYLVQLFITTKNYSAALKSMDQLQSKDPKLASAYQKIYYYSAIELFNDKQYETAINLFKNAAEAGNDGLIKAESDYWIGESFYRMQNYWGASKYFKSFLQQTSARRSEFYKIAKYNLAYIHFDQEEYSQAIRYYSEYLKEQRGENTRFVNDAYLRLGDCFYVTKDYQKAISNYNSAARMNHPDKEYAVYKKALAFGAMGKLNDKIVTLEQLATANKASSYYDDALYELGTTYLLNNNSTSAVRYFNRLVQEKPRSSYAKKALLRTGLVYYNNDQNTTAIKALKQVLTDYPGTAEATEAMSSLKNIYVEMNRVNEFLDYTRNLGIVNITVSEQDSLSFTAAENQYMEGNCNGAISSFEDYIRSFPNGAYLIKANYYKSECEFKAERYEDALEGYTYVISQPPTRFTETALLKASRINYNLKNYQEALADYNLLAELADSKDNILEARLGQMRCSYFLQDFNFVINSAKEVLKNDRVNQDQINEAHYLLAKSYYETSQAESAIKEFEIAENLTDNELAAESKYYIAQLQYEQNKFAESESTIFELSNKYSYYDFWVAKGFILLSDVYVQMDNLFQAKQTLQSIIDNYQGDELRDIAKQKLQEIIYLENQQASKKQ